ncbi:TraR/DksA C4-type zinc finger protein [Jeotgalibacillus proteolyticus]|uniref:TraR/DksA C4-type zinc finger protein n=1 Tax=Jeotgalibacillus proteolyticus TaxID=2082395 RepID=UPI003CED383F
MLTIQQQHFLRSELLARKKALEVHFKHNDHFDLQRSQKDAVGELSSYDNHPGDLASELYEREKDLALNEHERFELEGILAALQAMEVGMYGRCITCTEEIPYDRLEALPATRYCVDHTPDRYRSQNRPIEEKILTADFRKTERSKKKESAVYDSEDSWQDVARYGSSDSPSDLEHPPSEYENMYADWEENHGYAEEYENFVGVDLEGNMTVYPNKQHERYEDVLDEENIMSLLGDLPAEEKDPYTD